MNTFLTLCVCVCDCMFPSWLFRKTGAESDFSLEGLKERFIKRNSIIASDTETSLWFWNQSKSSVLGSQNEPFCVSLAAESAILEVLMVTWLLVGKGRKDGRRAVLSARVTALMGLANNLLWEKQTPLHSTAKLDFNSLLMWFQRKDWTTPTFSLGQWDHAHMFMLFCVYVESLMDYKFSIDGNNVCLNFVS